MIQPNKSLGINFNLLSKKTLRQVENTCVDEENYSLTECLKDFIFKEVGCTLHWFQYNELPICSTKMEIKRTQDLFDMIQTTPWTNLTVLTGCLQKCRSMKYEIAFITKENILWEKEWISEVFIQPNAASMEEVVEYLVYGVGDFIGDLGGYLGLFLGWSILSMTINIPGLLKQIWLIITNLHIFEQIYRILIGK